mgnify:CR=1 FL=1
MNSENKIWDIKLRECWDHRILGPREIDFWMMLQTDYKRPPAEYKTTAVNGNGR